MSLEKKKVLVIGAGLAGSEAALFLANQGVNVVLFESKKIRPNAAQKMTTCAELVCTNSLKSLKEESAHGLLKREMKAFSSVVLEVGETCSVPAGDALAVDREIFSQKITQRLQSHPQIEFVDRDISSPLEVMKEYNANCSIVCTGPLTTDSLSNWIEEEVSTKDFHFYDAIAPVVEASSLDFTKLYWKDRHSSDPEKADYLNAPFTKEEYEVFIEGLRSAEKVPAKDFEDYIYFESCLPIDVMAERGVDTARFSCLKPIGLELEDGKRPYAVAQLRKENLLGDAFNLVGMQTKLTYKEQLRVFRLIPGLEKAQFLHLGSVHRNSFLNSKELLSENLSLKKHPNVFFAGQITGVEGYTESASMGLYAAFQVLCQLKEIPFIPFPVESAMGALVNYIMTMERPAPSSINFGLLPSLDVKIKGKDKKKIKRKLISEKSMSSFDSFFQQRCLDVLGKN